MKVKKFIITTASFALCSFLFCLVWTLIFKSDLPPLLEVTVRKYKALLLLKMFLDILPAVAATGLLVGMALVFGEAELDEDGRVISRKSTKRFSMAMLARYKKVLLSSLAVVFVVTLCEEVAKEDIANKLQFYKRLPTLTKEYKEFSDDLYKAGQFTQSFEMAKKAYTLNKKDLEAKALMDRAEGVAMSSVSKKGDKTFLPPKVAQSIAASKARKDAKDDGTLSRKTNDKGAPLNDAAPSEEKASAKGGAGVTLGATSEGSLSLSKDAEGFGGSSDKSDLSRSKGEGGTAPLSGGKSEGALGNEIDRNISALTKHLYPQYTFSDLMEKSKKAFAAQEYFDAHYWARLAADLVGPRSSSYAQAQSLVAQAWNALEKISVEKENPNQELFSRKMAGYNALVQGDAVKAYYIFRTLSLEGKYVALDPDIARFLKESEQRMKKDFFFSDETLNMAHFENCNDVYFRLPSATVAGGVDIFYIKGVTTTKEQNALVQYLRGFCVIHIDGNGEYSTGEYYPYVKMSALDTEQLGEELCKDLKIPEGVRYIPQVLLVSADRDTPNTMTKGFLIHDAEKEGHFRAMRTIDAQAKLPNATDNPLPTDEVHMTLLMDYRDFELLKAASKGLDAMGISDLLGFTAIASNYGYPQRVYSQALLNHTLYPLFFLCALIGVATLSWHGRLDNQNHIFKFKWVSVMPIFCVLFVLVYNFILCVYKLVNYNLFNRVAMPYSILMGAFFYVMLFVVLSIIFLSCHDRKPGDE